VCVQMGRNTEVSFFFGREKDREKNNSNIHIILNYKSLWLGPRILITNSRMKNVMMMSPWLQKVAREMKTNEISAFGNRSKPQNDSNLEVKYILFINFLPFLSNKKSHKKARKRFK
jgi:hypothetical protein